MSVRTLVIMVVVAAVIAGGAVAIHLSLQHGDDDQKTVLIHASYTKAECNTQNPVKVTVENGSEKTLKALSFDLNVFLDGDSTNLSGVDAPQTWTKVVPAHSTASTCMPLPRAARERIAHGTGHREYSVRVEGHFASFYAEGEFVPPEAASVHRKTD